MRGRTVFRGRLALVAVLSGLGIATPLGTAPASATHLTAGTGGPTVPWGFNEDWGWTPDGQFSTELLNDQMEKAGAIMPDSLSANRFHVQWADVEWQRGSYDWTRTDPVYEAMEQHTPYPVMVLYNTPVWARDPAATCPSDNPCAYPPLAEYDSEWKEFVQAAVSRYGNVRAIEVWNEPNIGRFWAPAPSPERYAAVLRAAHEGLAAAGSAAPVLSGGLVPTQTGTTSISAPEFLRQLYALGAAADFEGIASHPYPRQPPLVETMWNRITALTEVRDQNADAGTPLWITEVGVSTDTTSAAGVLPEQQGDELIRLYHSIEDHEIGSFIIHRLHDLAPGDADEGSFFNQTGVLASDLSPKPAYCELGAAIGEPCPDTTPPEPQPAPQAQPQPEADRTLSLAANKGKVEKGRKVTLSGQLDAPQNEVGCEPNQTVELQRKPKNALDSAFATFASLQSDRGGNFAAKVKIKKTLIYRAVVAETAACDDEVSNTKKVRVQKKKVAREA